jgi:hypothetical protein
LEVTKGNVTATLQRLDCIKDIDVLRINDNIKELADVYFRLLNIPE